MASRRRWIPITLYFILNLLVTSTNKQILGTRSEAKFQQPYLLTAVHGMSTFVGCKLLSRLYHPIPKHTSDIESALDDTKSNLTWSQYAQVALFSLFYTINIALSNLSLAMVNLPLNQTIRATAPVLTFVMSVLVARRHVLSQSTSTYLSLLPTTFGVIIAIGDSSSDLQSRDTMSTGIGNGASGDHHYHRIGVVITLLGALTAVLKTIITNKLLTSLSFKLSSLELLQIISPFAAVQALAFSYVSGEFQLQSPFIFTSIINKNGTSETTNRDLRTILTANVGMHFGLDGSTIILWMLNAISACLLNIASFEANKQSGPVSMAVAANVKQIAILAMPLIAKRYGAHIYNGQEATHRVIVGSLLTVVGGIWYALSTAKIRTRRTNLVQGKELSGGQKEQAHTV